MFDTFFFQDRDLGRLFLFRGGTVFSERTWRVSRRRARFAGSCSLNRMIPGPIFSPFDTPSEAALSSIESNPVPMSGRKTWDTPDWSIGFTSFTISLGKNTVDLSAIPVFSRGNDYSKKFRKR